MKNFKQYIIIAASLLTLGSCSDYLDVTPSDKQTAEQLFGSKAGFYAAQNGVYDALASDALYGKQMTWEAIEVLSQSFSTDNVSTYYKNLNAGAYTEYTVANNLSSIWQKAYETILAANLLMEQVNNQNGILSKAEADMMKGEMLAVRAFLHLDMLRLFGPTPTKGYDQPAIPYNESTNITVLDLLTIKQVGEKIIRDLDEAEKLLAEDPIIKNGPMMSDPEDGSSVQNRYRQYRFNIYAVKALKARAYIWVGEDEKAYKAATDLIIDENVQKMFPAVDPNTLLFNPKNPDRVFSSEVLVGIYDKDRDNVYNNYFASTAPTSQFLNPYSGFVSGTGSSLFTNMILGPETSDYRFQSQWEANSNTAGGYCFSKYKKIDRPDMTDENSEYYYAKMIPLIRMHEMYLIAMETASTPLEQVLWYDQIRGRRGNMMLEPIGYLPMFAQYWEMGYSGLFTSNEYRREFWGEGQWMYYTKRVEPLAAMGVEGTGVSYYSENGNMQNFTSIDVNLPLPAAEMK